MLRLYVAVAACLLAAELDLVNSAKQQVQLSDSYLPVAMQVIAHLTDQMAFEVKDEPTAKPQKPPVKPLNPTTQPPRPNDWTTRPTNSWPKPTTQKPYVTDIGSFPTGLSAGSWWMNIGSHARGHQTTPFHRPGLFAPVAPPKPSDRTRVISKAGFILLPFENTQYTVIEPKETRTDEPLLSMHHDEVKPLIEPAKNPQLLPPHFEVVDNDKASRIDDLNDDNLQYLSQNVQEMIKMARDPDNDRIVDVWEGMRGAHNQEVMPKAKLSSSNLRLLLLYDLLSREAKRLRLSDYSGFSPDVMKQLVESSSGGARAQLGMALAKMVERRDCEHEYANNRAKEMVAELGRDESTMSSELRYLQPIDVFRLEYSQFTIAMGILGKVASTFGIIIAYHQILYRLHVLCYTVLGPVVMMIAELLDDENSCNHLWPVLPPEDLPQYYQTFPGPPSKPPKLIEASYATAHHNTNASSRAQVV